ncbi:putative TRAF3-interacting protein [Phytophthora cinnamomi]|uniref:putative TRAF3-interacting protein n=1 Tax=Phytophthora cinnamomi TaxID=4785 RepID=UPI00355A2011|nr:putative TRAF3-interacting protein [Phytophthora cinnamomi]
MKFDLMDKPERIWNCDETVICPQGHTGERVIFPKGLRANVQRSDDRENVSIMACVSAAGDRMPPLYIFKGKYKQKKWMVNAEKKARCAVSESSNINGKLFVHWLKWLASTLLSENTPLPDQHLVLHRPPKKALVSSIPSEARTLAPNAVRATATATNTRAALVFMSEYLTSCWSIFD